MLNPLINKNYLKEIEYERYSRHLILEEMSESGQKRIKAAKVLFVGAGGLNSPSLLYLTASGIGTIGIIDHDKIELSNLQRQIIYNTNDIKKYKVEAAKNTLKLLNPLIQIKTYHYTLTENNAYNIIADYDIIIDGTDNFKSRYIISECCYLLHKIHIYGAVEKFIGQVSVFNYQNGPNYNNLYKESLNVQQQICNERGILNTLPGIISMIQATETIKIITGIGHIINGYLLRYNLLNLSTKRIRITPQKTLTPTLCDIDNTRKSLLQPVYISIKKMNTLLEYKDSYYQLIDIRETKEFQLQHLKYAINIPLTKLKKLKTAQYIKKQFHKKTIIIYCNNELRSYIASKILNKYQIRHFILKGGMNKT